MDVLSMYELKNKTVVITGAASGIGRMLASRLACEGATVVLGDIDEDRLHSIHAEIGGAALSRVLDISDPDECASLIQMAYESTRRVDVLCNIAGILHVSKTESITPDEWVRVINVNLTGTFYMCQAALPKLARTKGCIINLASSTGLVGMPFGAAYVASKHGVVGLTRALALEFAEAGIRINAICPTGVRTPMVLNATPTNVDDALLQRCSPWLNKGGLLDPEEVVEAIIFLQSKRAQSITGIALPIDGGLTAS